MDWFLKIKDMIKKKFPAEPETPGKEKRRSFRQGCKIPGVITFDAGDKMQVVVTNISFSGMRLESQFRVSPADKIELRIGPAAVETGEGIFISAKVLWCRMARREKRFAVGVQYNEKDEYRRKTFAMFVLEKCGFQTKDLGEKRKALRVPAKLNVKYKDKKGREEFGIILDLSKGGLLMEAPGRFEVGDELNLEFGARKGHTPLQLKGKVLSARKYSGGKPTVGIEFLNPALEDEQELTLLIAELMSQIA